MEAGDQVLDVGDVVDALVPEGLGVEGGDRGGGVEDGRLPLQGGHQDFFDDPVFGTWEFRGLGSGSLAADTRADKRQREHSLDSLHLPSPGIRCGNSCRTA